MDNYSHPKVGLGVIIVNEEGNILVGKRKGGLAPKYSIPGGNLEIGESFEGGAIREIKVIAVTNNLETYKEEGKHHISIVLLATKYSGELKNMEPQKKESWDWVDPKKLPEPHFDASYLGVKCYLKGSFYEGLSDTVSN